jgi:hypothetical protein
MESWKQTLTDLASTRLGSLKRHAFLLCGDNSQAEDLVQGALVRAFARPLRAPQPGAAVPRGQPRSLTGTTSRNAGVADSQATAADSV